MRRAIGAVGRALITAGVLILGFVAYQLWGTGLLEARAQDDLRDEFEAQLDQPARASTRSSGGDPPGSSTTSTSSTTTTTTTTAPPAPPAVPPEGEPVAIVRIPKIGVDKVVVEGTTVADLRKGPGHYAGTPLPGQVGNAAIAGHRTTYGAPFGELGQLGPGDVISVETVAGTYDYRVDETLVVAPDQVEVLDPPANAEAAALTLTTCNPKYSARERLVVKATLPVDEPEPLPAPADAGGPISLDAGLSGTRASRVPVALWSLVVAIVGGAWWLLFHRHRGWTTWLAGVLPFAAVLVVFYVYLERVLPSNY